MQPAKIPVSLFWFQDHIPADVQACLDSWCDDARMAGEVYTAPSAEQFFRARGMTRELEAFHRCGPYAMASDYVRLHLLLARGGLYVDANWAQVQPFAPNLDALIAEGRTGLISEINAFYRTQPDPLGQFLIAQGGDVLLNGILFFSAPNDPFLTLCADICLRNIEEGVCEQIAFAAGSGVMAALLLLREFETRSGYVAVLEDMATRPFGGKDVSSSIASVIAVTEGQDHAVLRSQFAGIKTVPGESLLAYMTRNGLGQTHKDHWTRHEGSLYVTP